MAKLATAACLLLALASAGVGAARLGAKQAHRRQLLAGSVLSPGWYYTMKTDGGNYCGLRDFPPIPNGYGESRLYCPLKTYNHFFTWRVIKVGSGAISSGDQVQLYVQQPMLKWCKSGALVTCGVASTAATNFTVEKKSGTGTVNLISDVVYLKVGNSYCGLRGRKHSQQLKCDQSKDRATGFTFPASSFAAVTLTNVLTTGVCGGEFYSEDEFPVVTCNGRRWSGFSVNFTVALQTPGAPTIDAGSGVGFKVADNLYAYQVSNWKVSKQSKVYFGTNDLSGDAQWFSLERVSGAATGGPVALNGTVVALKSLFLVPNKYCGVNSTALNAQLVCDNAGPVGSLPNGYRYRINQLA